MGSNDNRNTDNNKDNRNDNDNNSTANSRHDTTIAVLKHELGWKDTAWISMFTIILALVVGVIINSAASLLI